MINRSKTRMGMCITALVCILVFIWGNSALPSSVSGALSSWLRSLLGFTSQGSEEAGEGLLRKIAHFCEFAALGMCLGWLWGMLRCGMFKVAALAVACSALSACVDEIIQIFSPGRNPSLKDVGLDTAGAAVGIVLLLIGYTFIKNKNKIWRNTK